MKAETGDGADPQTITVVGLGEAGHRYAEDLARAGHRVVGFGRTAPRREDVAYEVGVDLAGSVSSAQLVLSLVGGQSAEQTALDVLDVLPPGGVLVDLNTTHPDLMSALARHAETRGRRFTDAAIMAPVPRRGAGSPLLLCGTGAADVAAVFSALGAEAEVLPGDAGDAARLKLLRSVLMKGLAAVLLEATSAAASVGQREWMHRQIIEVLAGDAEALVARLLSGSHTHARRRATEMTDVVAVLDELGQHAWVSTAARAWLEDLAGLGRSTIPPPAGSAR